MNATINIFAAKDMNFVGVNANQVKSRVIYSIYFLIFVNF